MELAAAAERVGIRRFVLVFVFPEAWRERPMDASFGHYMREKKKAETGLVLIDLDWLIVRLSALTDEPGTGLVDLRFAKLHVEVPRDDVATTTNSAFPIGRRKRNRFQVGTLEPPMSPDLALEYGSAG